MFELGLDSPFMRDPIGSPLLFIRTQALSSNLTTVPSGRWYFLVVRTTTAWRISPRRTLFAAVTEELLPAFVSGPKLRCFCTTTIMRSPAIQCVSLRFESSKPDRSAVPILACRFILIRFMHSTMAAPELSMQFSIVWYEMSNRSSCSDVTPYLELYHRC